jgi:predicted RNase H-like nuclease (RuvC/YqgF family)
VTDETTTGQAPEPTTPSQAPGTDDSAPTTEAPDAQVEKLRKEAAKWRTQLREAQSQIETLAPLADEYQKQQEAQKTEAEKAAQRIAELEKTMAEKETQAAQAAAQVELLRMASKAGVDPDVASLLDLSKLDLDDEAATIETLQKLAPAARAGSAANPGRGHSTPEDSEASIREWYANRGTSTSMFG